MRNILWIFLFLSLSCGFTPKDLIEVYRVLKIEKYGSTYVVYVSSGENRYKIISGGAASGNCRPLEVGDVYKLNLNRLRQDAPVINGVRLDPASTARKMCMNFGGKQICTEPEKGMYELYSAQELQSNYYCKSQ